MNTKKLLPIILSFLFFSCNTSTQKENDLKKMELKGKVKFYKDNVYEAIEKFGKIQNESEISKPRKELFFNVKGNKIEENSYYLSGDLWYKIIFIYNENENLIEENEYKSDGNLRHKHIYKYDEDGNLIEKNLEGTGDIIQNLYQYDEQNNLIEEVAIFKGGSKVKKLYRYDEKGRLILKESYNYGYPSTEYLASETTYKYDKEGHLVEKKYYTTIRDYEEKEIYVYDGEKLIEYIKEGEFISKGERDYYLRKTYTKYDKKGNWIEEIEFNKDNKPIKIIEREIEYY